MCERLKLQLADGTYRLDGIAQIRLLRLGPVDCSLMLAAMRSAPESTREAPDLLSDITTVAFFTVLHLVLWRHVRGRVFEPLAYRIGLKARTAKKFGVSARELSFYLASFALACAPPPQKPPHLALLVLAFFEALLRFMTCSNALLATQLLLEPLASWTHPICTLDAHSMYLLLAELACLCSHSSAADPI